MEQWDAEYIDLEVPAYIAFVRNQGAFQFGTVRGWLDCRYGMRGNLPLVEFSWDGNSDGDPGSGRGWANLTAGRLEGHIFIHCSDDSSFRARRKAAAGSRPKRS
jgi:hypothetical protein